MNTTKKVLIWVVGTALAVLVICWGISFLKCEALTRKYSYQFEEIYKDYTMFEDPDDIKILEYEKTEAVVYYVTKGSGGDIVKYRRDGEDGQWQFVNWETVWSRTGSASGFVWPYIR